MVMRLSDEERATLLAELVAERYGTRLPWREAILPARRVRDDPRVCAMRRRLLGLALDGVYVDDRPWPAAQFTPPTEDAA